MFSNKIRLAVIALILANLIWGASTPILKLTLETIPPFSLAFIRFFFASAIFLIYLLFKKLTLNFQKKDLPQITLAAIFGVPLNIGFYFLGTKYTSAVNVSVISALAPVFTVAVMKYFYHEQIRRIAFCGIIISFLGTLYMIGEPLVFGNHNPLLNSFGIFLNVLAAGSGAVYPILNKKFINKYSSSILTAYAFVIGCLGMLFPALWESLNNPLWIYKINGTASFGLLYLIIGNSLIAYSVFNFSLKFFSPTAVNTAGYLMPIAGIALALPLLHEPLTPPFIIGSFIIALGVFLAESRHTVHPLHRKGGK